MSLICCQVRQCIGEVLQKIVSDSCACRPTDVHVELWPEVGIKRQLPHNLVFVVAPGGGWTAVDRHIRRKSYTVYNDWFWYIFKPDARGGARRGSLARVLGAGECMEPPVLLIERACPQECTGCPQECTGCPLGACRRPHPVHDAPRMMSQKGCPNPPQRRCSGSLRSLAAKASKGSDLRKDRRKEGGVACEWRGARGKCTAYVAVPTPIKESRPNECAGPRCFATIRYGGLPSAASLGVEIELDVAAIVGTPVVSPLRSCDSR